jgi:tetratricopeptide (TPR) repeat protein
MKARLFPRALRIAAVAGIVVLLAACGGAQSRLAGHMERGKEYLAAGSLKKASVEFRNALQIDPKNVDAQLMHGRVAEQLGDLRDAVRAYQTAIELDPAGAAGPAALGRLYVFGGAPDKALELVAPALEKHPGNADLLTVRGAARAQQKDVAGALEDAEAALLREPGNENAVALAASLYRQSQQEPRALAIVEKAVAAQPQSVDLRQILAILHAEAGRAQAAEEQLRKVIELRPEQLAHRTRLALFYARAKRPDDAQRTLEAAVKELPDNDDAKLQLVDFIANQRSREQGEKTLRDFVAQQPKNMDLRLGLGALLQREKADQEAIKVYREIVAADDGSPKSLIARDRIAAMQVAAGDLAAARTTIDETLKLNPRDNDALTLRAGLALDRHDAPSAIADLRAVLREQPDAVTVRRTLARAHFENGEPALAEDVLREAMQLAPQDLQLRVDLAQLLSQTNRSEQSVALLEEAVRLAPADVPAREMLVRAYLATKDLTAARTAAEDLKTLRPSGASGWYLAGLVAQSQGRADEALAAFSHALELQPRAMDALAGYARLQAGRGKPDDALARVRAATTAEPRNAIARNLLGELLLLRKSYAEAISEFNAAIAAGPQWAVPYRNLALSRIASQDLAGGAAAYEAGVKATNYAAELVTDLGALYERQGKADAAIALYDHMHQRDPRQELAANNLAMLLVTYRKDKESLDRAKQLTAGFASSDSGSLLDTSGWVRFKLGENQDALQLLERAVERAPDSRAIRYHLAMAQLSVGQDDKARDNLEAVLKGDVVFAGRDEARAALESLKRRAG